MNIYGANMSLVRHNNSKAFTLIEMLVSMIVLVVIVFGTLSYQYLAAAHVPVAKAQMIAARTAQLLMEDWKSRGGSAEYDPTSLDLGFKVVDEVGADYMITVDALPMYIALSHNDIGYDAVANITLREITVKVIWRRDPSRIENSSALTMTTYVRADTSGG